MTNLKAGATPKILLNEDEDYFYCIEKAGLYCQSFDGRTGIVIPWLYLLWSFPFVWSAGRYHVFRRGVVCCWSHGKNQERRSRVSGRESSGNSIRLLCCSFYGWTAGALCQCKKLHLSFKKSLHHPPCSEKTGRNLKKDVR